MNKAQPATMLPPPPVESPSAAGRQATAQGSERRNLRSHPRKRDDGPPASWCHYDLPAVPPRSGTLSSPLPNLVITPNPEEHAISPVNELTKIIWDGIFLVEE